MFGFAKPSPPVPMFGGAPVAPAIEVGFGPSGVDLASKME